MSDASDERGRDEEPQSSAPGQGPDGSEEAADVAELREQVEAAYDFDDFGPDQMAEMDPEEWDAVFDPDTWITGEELLDRVEADLKTKVHYREVFARVERLADGTVIAYSDEGYAAVHPDGSVDGFGTVLRDVKPTVALCSMDSYEVSDPPAGEPLPEPTEVPEGSGELGNVVVQVIAGVQLLAGVGLVLAWLLFVSGVLQPPSAATGRTLNLTLMVVVGGAFVVIGLFLLTLVANARLSDRFRAEEYRDRLRDIGVGTGERPDFLPVENDRWVGDDESRSGGAGSPVRDEG